MTTRLIFLGPPGAGKGTQAKFIADFCHIPHISTGEILRKAKAAGTNLGKKAQSYMDKGELVPDELIFDLIRERLGEDDTKSGWILDGFPRNVNQASFLDKLLGEINQNYDHVLNIDVPDTIVVDRILGRAKIEGRVDDTEEVISNRLQVYRDQTAPLIDYYTERSKLVSIDGDRSLEEVTNSLKQIVNV